MRDNEQCCEMCSIATLVSFVLSNDPQRVDSFASPGCGCQTGNGNQLWAPYTTSGYLDNVLSPTGVSICRNHGGNLDIVATCYEPIAKRPGSVAEKMTNSWRYRTCTAFVLISFPHPFPPLKGRASAQVMPSPEPQGMPSFACRSPDDLFGNVQDLTYTTKISGTKPFAYGGYSDIWRGYEWGSGATRTVAIKIIRVATRQTRISREIIAWNAVGHQNILPFYGLFWPDGRDALPAMVYPYCEAGTCSEYLANNVDADRMAIIRQVADGLHHLHSFNPPIAHGDIKAANILMKQDGTPLIADFGLSRLVMEFSTGLTTSSSRGSYRWMAPELFGGIDSYVLVLVTPASDVWAFGCLCLEILLGVLPWASTRNDAAVMLAVVKNRQSPPLPTHTGSLPIGHIIRHCWVHEPSQRPSMLQLVNALFETDPEHLHTPTCVLLPPAFSDSPPAIHNSDLDSFTRDYSDSPLVFSPSDSHTITRTKTPVASVPFEPLFSPREAPSHQSVTPVSTTGATPYLDMLSFTPSDSGSSGPASRDEPPLFESPAPLFGFGPRRPSKSIRETRQNSQPLWPRTPSASSSNLPQISRAGDDVFRSEVWRGNIVSTPSSTRPSTRPPTRPPSQSSLHILTPPRTDSRHSLHAPSMSPLSQYSSDHSATTTSLATPVTPIVEIDPELLHTPTCILPQPSVSSDSPTFSDGPTPLESATVFPDQLVVPSTLPSTNEDVFNPSLWQMIGVDTPYNVHLLTGPSSQSLLPHHSHAAPSVPRNLHSPTSKPIQTSTATPDDRLVALTNHPSYPWQRPRIPNASRHGLKERMKEERHWQQDEATPARKEQPKHEILEEQRRPKRTKFCPDGGTSNVSISQIASSPQPTRPQKGKLIEHAALMPSFFVQTSPGSLEGPTLEDAPISMKMTVHEVIAHLVAHGCQDLTDAVDPTTFSEHPVSHGGFSDIYCGRLLNDSRVAIKTLRVSIGSIAENPKHFKHAARELHTWGKCLHPNVLQLYGLAVFRGRIGMVSPWQGQGSLPRYLERTPGVDRCNLCAQIGDGLSYLHQIGIIHGDLKGANVLVSDDGIPVLTDFGNSIYSDQSMRFTETTSSSSITVRWSAAELITGLGAHTEASDVYALAMTIYEVLAGILPYDGLREHTIIYLVVTQSKPPTRPKSIPDGKEAGDQLWDLLLRCWSFEPEKRPNANEVTIIMKTITPSSLLPISNETTEPE
ncbi:unnamed protein product [Rhizoctonia solani]|uniref:Protein kinase domain-containing protein n=1 Tax=Rhizoctonia solani TaxID=456999 RepID=A0A8H3GW79_9AGAM|nr:unnamed protein product [Rhizoctonia solani]